MTTQITLREYATGRMIGMRSSAVPIRRLIELALARGDEISIDFSGVEVTQSFIDELLGAVILRQGFQIMNQVVLKGCSPSTKGIVEFVANDRAQQYSRTASHSGISLHRGQLAAVH